MELNPLKQIDPVVIASVVGVFTVTHFVLRKSFFLPVIEVMERRQSKLETAAAQRDEAARLARGAEVEADDLLARARGRAERVAQAVRDRAQTERKARLDSARAKGATLVEAGRQSIAQEREAELATLRAETSACVTLACERLLDRVDPHTVDSVVTRLVERRVH